MWLIFKDMKYSDKLFNFFNCVENYLKWRFISYDDNYIIFAKGIYFISIYLKLNLTSKKYFTQIGLPFNFSFSERETI